MGLTLADQYYLKALDDYNYNFEAVMENLNYALSYEPEHAGSIYLMGKLYMEQFQKFDLAEEYFVSAMSSDPININTCESYSWLLIRTRRFKEALKLLNYASNLKGAILPEFIRSEALVYELMYDFDKSKNKLEEALMQSYDDQYISFLKKEIVRVAQKKKKAMKVKCTMIW